MALVALIEVVALVGLGWLVLSQFVLPIIKGDPVLPMFWSMADTLDAEKAKLEQQLEDKRVAEEVEALRKKLLHKDGYRFDDGAGNEACPETEEVSSKDDGPFYNT